MLEPTPATGRSYRWNFDAEGSIDIDATGPTATWSFDEAKTYKVCPRRTDRPPTNRCDLTVYAESAEPPTAEIAQYADDEDCENEEIRDQVHPRLDLWGTNHHRPRITETPFSWTHPIPRRATHRRSTFQKTATSGTST